MKLYTNVWGKVRQSEDNAFFLSTNGKFNVVFYLFSLLLFLNLRDFQYHTTIKIFIITRSVLRHIFLCVITIFLFSTLEGKNGQLR